MIRRARQEERRQWWELYWPAFYLVLMAINCYQLHYWAAVVFYALAVAIATLNYTSNARHLRWLRETKRKWAGRRAQWQAMLDKHLEQKERGFE